VTPETWLEELAHELASRGVPSGDAASALVEVEGHLAESATRPLDELGTPAAYAEVIAAALDGARARSGSTGRTRLAVHDLTVRYRRRTVLDRVDVEVGAGEVTLVMGPNGCGKSTLLRAVAGLITLDAGTVSIDGTVGYAPQAGGLVEHLRPVEHLVLFGAGRGLERADAVAQGLRLAADLGWDAAAEPVVGDLSGGTRQKLNVVLALLGDPDLLLLDEPYQGLDLDSRRRFWELLWAWGDGGGAALVVTHDHDAIERAHAVVELPALDRAVAR
jgi:ABC-type multidrug transport system ATPase subunit